MNQKLLIGALVCVVVAAGIYGLAYFREGRKGSVATTTPATIASKAAQSSVVDGTYTAEIQTIMTTAENSAITFVPVQYFEGTDATTEAKKDISCEKLPLASCAPTLTRDYYVRASGDADFTAPVTKNTTVSLKDASSATIRDLRALTRDLVPVFEVVIKDGTVLSITEKSPVADRKG